MTGAELRQWRENHGLSQAQLAAHLQWTRDMVANRELDRATIPDGMDAILGMVAQLLASEAKPPARKTNSKAMPSRVILSVDGRRQAPEYRDGLSVDQCYWYYTFVDSKTGHHVFNLHQMGHDHDGALRGLSTPLCLDVNTWTIAALLQADDPRVKAALARFEPIIAGSRANHPQSLEETIRPNPQAPPINPGIFAT